MSERLVSRKGKCPRIEMESVESVLVGQMLKIKYVGRASVIKVAFEKSRRILLMKLFS